MQAKPLPTLSRCLWTFAILGALVGYATVMTLMVAATADSVSDFAKIPKALLMAAPIGIPFAWVVGLVPALVVGAIYWKLRAKETRNAKVAAALSALAAFIIYGSIVAISDGSLAALGDFSFWMMMIAPGAVATAACAWSIERRMKQAMGADRSH
jgi:hypothetical protein